MRGSVTATFSELEEFQAAASGPGGLELILTGRGRFRARSTEVMLHQLRLLSAEENLARIAFISVPSDLILVSLAIDHHAGPAIWGGVPTQAKDLVTVGTGQSVHMRTEGPCHWGTLWLPERDLARYAGALTGNATAIPSMVCRWQFSPSSNKQLHHLFAAAIRTARAAIAIAGDEAAHGLDQQLIYLLVECLSSKPADMLSPAMRRGQELMIHFEHLIKGRSQGDLDMTQISKELSVSDRFLRQCCKEHLGMGPMSYIRLRRMQLANRALRQCASPNLRIAEVAERFGFHNPGRFAVSYRELYGELPSATLRRSSNRRFPDNALHRTRGNVSLYNIG